VRGTFGDMAPDLHPDVEPLRSLLGAWRGEGKGEYPTMDPFDYGERIIFEHVGDAFLAYAQWSWLAGDGTPLHFERGFLRPGNAEGGVELMLAHPLGLTEVSEGVLRGGSMRLASRSIGRTSTGMALVGLERRYRIDGDELTYEIDMATETTPMVRHLTGRLGRLDR
jgi:THAP4-like, heme-binding beta-barrel domain